MCSGGYLPHVRVNVSSEVNLDVRIKSEGETMVSLPHSMDFGLQIGDNLNHWNHSDNFSTFVTPSSCNIPGGPSSFRNATDNPAFRLWLLL